MINFVYFTLTFSLFSFLYVILSYAEQSFIKKESMTPRAQVVIDGETMETVTDFIFLGSKITAAMKLKDACSLEEKLWPT